MRRNICIPELSKEKMLAVYAQQRPFREGGNRLEKVTINGKVIVHNYGHGGAGVSLAPGSAIEAVRIAEQIINKNSHNNIAVLGCGIVGLFNCYELLKKYPNLKITIYADRIPHFGQKDNDKLITSQVAPGFWLPYHYGSNNTHLHTNLSTLSLKEYEHLSKKEQYKSVLKHVEMIDITDEQFKDDYWKVLPEQLKPTYKDYTIKLNNATTVQCRGFTTIKIDMQPFLHIFIEELKARGVKFISKIFKDEASLTDIPEDIIFNCLGLGSKRVFNDAQMKGIKGHLVQFKNQNPGKYDYFLRANIGKQIVNLYMHDTRIILGLTRQTTDDCKVDLKTVDHLIDSHQKVLQKFGLSPHCPKL